MSKPSNQINEKSMSALILAHLQSGKTITNVEAQALWRCRALPKRISELRERGYEICAERRWDSTGQLYVRYRLYGEPQKIKENK